LFFDDLDIAVRVKTPEDALASLRVIRRYQANADKEIEIANALGDIFFRMVDLRFPERKRETVRQLYLRAVGIEDFSQYCLDAAIRLLRSTPTIGA